jgi:hypothetical protein
MNPKDRVAHCAQEVKRCERELAKLVATEREALAAASVAISEFKSQRTAVAGKRVTSSKSDAEFAALAREGAAEELAKVRADLAQAEHAAKVAEVEPAIQATSVASFREATEAEFAKLNVLRSEIEAIEKSIDQRVQEFILARASVVLRASELGLPVSNLDYRKLVANPLVTEADVTARVPGLTDLLALLVKGPALAVATAKLNALQDALDRRAHLARREDRHASAQLAAVDAEITELRAALDKLGASRVAVLVRESAPVPHAQQPQGVLARPGVFLGAN